MAAHALEEEPWRGAILRQTKRFGTTVMAFDAASHAAGTSSASRNCHSRTSTHELGKQSPSLTFGKLGQDTAWTTSSSLEIRG